MQSKPNIALGHGSAPTRRMVLKSAFGAMAILGATLLLSGNATNRAVADDGGDEKNKKNSAAEIGKPAPDFTLMDENGTEYSLSDYKGKIVILEWYNPDCPYVKAAHLNGSLKNQGNSVNAENGKVWIAINSGGQGEQGTGIEHNKAMAKKYAMAYPILFDESGTVGRAYGAAKTPQMYVIDTKGILRYAGAIDNDAFAKKTKKGDPVINYVENAIAEIALGTEVTITKTRPYGCSVHYAPSAKKSDKKTGRGQNKKDK